jgi:hypothetical protein
MELTWREEQEDQPNIRERWYIANRNNRTYLIYSIINMGIMSAQIETSITNNHPSLGRKELIYFNREDKNGLPSYLNEWIQKGVIKNKKSLERIAK